MQDTDKTFVSILLDILAQHGVEHIICSPGSRNAPLLIAAAARQNFRKHFAVDERSAAFMALGVSLVSKNPVALICTSGTALLNYAPAVAEAYYQGIPLILISADRPLQWIDQDDSQTLRQTDALSNFVKNSYYIPAYGEENPELTWYVNRIVNDAMITSSSGKKGPVHLNIALAEPLGMKRENGNNPPRKIELLKADSIGNKNIIKELAEKVYASKVMLVAGFMQPDSRFQKEIAQFSRFPNVVVMTETISNLHLHPEDFSIDSVLSAWSKDVLDSMAPELVISVGGALVSRMLKEYLRRNSGRCSHWSVGFNHTTVDPFTSLSLRLEVEPSRFFRNLNAGLLKRKAPDSVADFQKKWQEARLKALALKQYYIENVPWSELSAFDLILKSLPAGVNLFLSNGTSIRYAQIIDYRLPHASYCNRGVSGIDGSLSSAIGGAIAYKGPSLLITGDLSLAYDIGALGLKEIPDSFKIIIIDNQGGGIFRFVPSTSSLEEREEYFCMKPSLPLKNLAEAYSWNYLEATDKDSLADALINLFDAQQKTILKVCCDGSLSAEILKNYMNHEKLENY